MPVSADKIMLMKVFNSHVPGEMTSKSTFREGERVLSV